MPASTGAVASLVAPQAGSWAAPAALSAAAVALGYALQMHNGAQQLDLVLYLSAALALCAAAVSAPPAPARLRLGEGALLALLVAALAFQMGELLTVPPGIYLRNADPKPFYRALALAAVLGGTFVSPNRWVGRLCVPLMLLVYLYVGVWLIKASPAPHIDVYLFQRDGAAALLSGTNPYELTYPNIYGNSAYYGAGLSVGGRLRFGFPYPPLSLLLALPGHVLGKDYRYSQLMATALAGGLMAYARPGRVAAAAMALFLFTPRTFMVLEQGWTEPYAVLLVAATVFVACRFRRALPYVLGLLLAVKQTLVFAAPAALLLLPRPLPSRRELLLFAGKAAGVATAVTLPFVLWNPRAFFWDVMMLQFYQPFRRDSLSYLAWFARDGGAPLPTWVAFAVALLALGLALWRAPRSPSGFAAAVSLTYLCFFAFNKQAFANYYYFVIGALCCAVAASAAPKASEGPALRPSGAGTGA
jgi:hypothetical protein